MTAEAICRGLGGHKSGSAWMAKCPAHNDGNPSLAITDKDGTVVVRCHAGCAQHKVIDALSSKGLWEPSEHKGSPIIAEYSYLDQAGELLYQITRHAPTPKESKPFRQRYPDGYGGWVWKKHERQVLYNLPEVLASPIIFVAEGEKDADTLRALGLVATTNAGGAKAQWLPSFTESLVGREVILIPDNDAPGRSRVITIARAIVGKVSDLSVVEVEGAKDVSDWFALGHSEAELLHLVQSKRGLTSLSDVDALERQWEVKYGAAVPGLKIRSVKELPSIRSFGTQKIDFIVEGLLADGTLTMIAGEPGSGKTTFVTALCSAVERGVPFAGLATQRRPVLILDRENPLPIVVERFDRLGINDSENFKVWGAWAADEPPDPGSPMILQWVQNVNPKPVIVVDSFIAFFKGDENDASEVRAYLNSFRLLASQGATVVFLHHSGKGENTKEYRGSSDFKGSVDVGYVLSNSGDSSRLNRLKLKVSKCRFSVEPETTFHYFDGVFSRDDRPASRTNEEIFQEIVIANPGLTARELDKLALEKGVHRARARAILIGWIDSGSVRVQKGPNNSSFHVWAGGDEDFDNVN